MGKIVLRDDVPATPLEQAEGYRYLLAQLSEQIEVAMYHSDPNDPRLRYNITKFRSAAMPSSDGAILPPNSTTWAPTGSGGNSVRPGAIFPSSFIPA